MAHDPKLEALSEATGLGKTDAQDEFEAQMAQGQPVLHRQKLSSPKFFHLLMGLFFVVALLGLGSNAFFEGTLQAWVNCSPGAAQACARVTVDPPCPSAGPYGDRPDLASSAANSRAS